MTKLCLLQQIFVATKVLSQHKYVYCNKTFVVTSIFYRGKRHVLSGMERTSVEGFTDADQSHKERGGVKTGQRSSDIDQNCHISFLQVCRISV